MAKPRKKWSTTLGGNPLTRRLYASQRATYEAVGRCHGLFDTGAPSATYTSVWVDERDGHGWQLYERIEHTRKDA